MQVHNLSPQLSDGILTPVQVKRELQRIVVDRFLLDVP
jgi:hypothetical protein